MKNISIILVNPQLGENIGLIARVMKNFSIYDLRIVSPRDGWPNISAESASVGAIDIINEAKIFSNLEDAISDLNYLLATTAQPREMNKDYISSESFHTEISNFDKIGIMFGRENNGLNNEEIKYANKILKIETNQDFSSLNISHAVCIVCYEIFKNYKEITLTQNPQDIISKNDLHLLYRHLFDILEENSFFKQAEKKTTMKRNIVNIFSRINNLSQSEYRTLRGILNNLYK